jgi:hypothetical protein
LVEGRKIPVGISVPPKILDAVDKDRGQVPRSTWVVEALEARLGREHRKGEAT